MAISYYLLQFPPLLLFTGIVLFASSFAVLSTYLFRKYGKIKVLRSHNEVTGFLFLSIASFYALLLSFVIFVVWDQLNSTQENVSKEGSSAMGLYRDIKFYPDTIESKKLMSVYLDFVYNVIDEDFVNDGNQNLNRKTPESFNLVFYKMERLNPKNQFQSQLVAEMFNHLNELATYRGLRNDSMETEIPAPMWIPIILGALITLFCAMLLDIEHMKLHLTLNALLAVFIGIFLFIIIILDHPFTGSLAIQPNSYMKIFTMEQWDKEQVEPIKTLQLK